MTCIKNLATGKRAGSPSGRPATCVCLGCAKLLCNMHSAKSNVGTVLVRHCRDRIASQHVRTAA